MHTIRHFIGLILATTVTSSSLFAQAKFALAVTGGGLYQAFNTTSSLTLSGANNGNPITVQDQGTGQGYSLDLLGRYALSKRWSVSTGIGMSQLHYPEPTIVTLPDLTQTPNQQQVIGMSTTSRWYQVPVLVHYQLSTKRLSPYFSLGTLLSFNQTAILPDGEKRLVRLHPLRVWPTVGAGASYQLNQVVNVVLQPNWTYIPIEGSAITYSNYQVGLQVQVLFKL